MLELEYGIVKHFDERYGRKFGFMYVLDEDGRTTEEEIFFHFNDGRFVDIIGDEVWWAGRVFRRHDGTSVAMWYPEVDSKLAFDRSPSREGRDKASPWTYAEGYDNLVRELTAPRYRLLKVTKHGYNDSRDTPQPVKTGLRDDELSAEFPIRVLDGVLIDPLAGSVDFGAGSTTRYLFEVWVDEDFADDGYGGGTPIPGHWEPCADPRFMSDEARALRSASVVRH